MQRHDCSNCGGNDLEDMHLYGECICDTDRNLCGKKNEKM